MGVLRVEPARARQWAARSIGAIWRAYDLQLTIYALLLTGIGLAMAYSNSVESGVPVLSPGSTLVRGLMWAGLAIVVFAVATAFDYTWFATFAWPVYVVNLGLLALTLAIGDGIGGSARWVSLGPLTIQFSEIAKILMIIVLANYLARRQGTLNKPWPIFGACLIMAPPAVLVLLQPDLGTSLVFGGIVAGMLFLSGASLRWLGLLAVGVIGAIPIAWTYVLHDYQRQRLLSFLYPALDPQGSGYQLQQAQIAVGSGAWFGKGLTNGTQDRGNFLPVQTTDFVFAKLGEELGFLGAIVVFALFVALLWRILVAGWRSRDPFGLLMSAGIASMILFQFVVNVGMVIGVMPITGIPLPFVTHGGASLISLAFGLGILQSVNIRQMRAEW
jgi:rod shape determining protein RodA